MRVIIGDRILINQYAQQQAGADDIQADHDDNERAGAAAALDEVGRPVGDRPINCKPHEDRLQDRRHDPQRQRGEFSACGEHPMRRNFERHFDGEKPKKPPWKTRLVGKQRETQHHEQTRRQVAREIEHGRPVAEVEPIRGRNPVTIFVTRQHEVADAVERDQGDELRARKPRPTGKHPRAEDRAADDRRNIECEENQRRTQAALSPGATMLTRSIHSIHCCASQAANPKHGKHGDTIPKPQTRVGTARHLGF